MIQHFQNELSLLIRSGFPIVFVQTQEEERAVALIEKTAKGCQRIVVCPRDMGQPFSLHEYLKKVTEEDVVVILDDVHRRLDQPETIRLFADIAWSFPKHNQTLVILAPWVDIPVELERHCSIISLPLPSTDELREVLNRVCVECQVLLTDEDGTKIVRAAQGMTKAEAYRTFKKAFTGWVDDADGAIGSVIRDKKLVLRRSGVLESIDVPVLLEEVGGLDRLKEWLDSRKNSFTSEAKAYGIPSPRGLLLMGIQGCGKSLSAKAVASHWQLPLVRLDVSAVFGELRPEAALKNGLRVAEAMSPVVLWIDEIEKGFDKGGEGPAARILGGMVTWLQEKTKEVFVVATANQVRNLPPELPRKGRFDEVFFVDLPDIHERQDILRIHLQKRERNPDDFDLEKLSKKTDKLTGSELEQLIIAGLHFSFSRGESLSDEDLLYAAKEIVPLYDTFEEEIKGLREWARKRARSASSDRSKADLFSN